MYELGHDTEGDSLLHYDTVSGDSHDVEGGSDFEHGEAVDTVTEQQVSVATGISKDRLDHLDQLTINVTRDLIANALKNREENGAHIESTGFSKEVIVDTLEPLVTMRHVEKNAAVWGKHRGFHFDENMLGHDIDLALDELLRSHDWSRVHQILGEEL